MLGNIVTIIIRVQGGTTKIFLRTHFGMRTPILIKSRRPMNELGSNGVWSDKSDNELWSNYGVME